MTRLTEQQRPVFQDIVAARERIAGQVRNTDVIENIELNKILGCDAWFKCENLQKTGAFKFRGASNAILRLRENGTDEDVATHSSGNHGAALATAAQSDGRNAHVVMPRNSVASKVEAVRRFGGKIVFCEPSQEAREAGLARLVAEGLIPIPPYDHRDIIAGQGTAALEFLESHPHLDILITPVGGGGLVSGSAIVVRHLRPAMSVFAAEPFGAADTAASFRQGKRVTSWQPDTIADGLRALVGEITFPIIRECVDNVLTVSEGGIVDGMKLVWQYTKMIIEPSSATVIAAIREHPELFAGKRVGLILTGGNIDRDQFPFLHVDRHD